MMNDNPMNVADMIGAEEAASRAVEKRREELLEEQKNRKKKLVKAGSILTLISIMMVFATRSWFTMSREVSGTGANMTADDLPFELEVRGNFVENSNIMTVDNLFTNEFKTGIQQEDGNGNLVNIFRTDGNDEKIVWRKNVLTSSYQQGLSPGSSGELTFWVIPNQTRVMNLYFNMNIRGYHAVYENEALSELIEINDSLADSAENAAMGITSAETKKTALKYVNSHILFFKNYNNETGKYSGFCGRDSVDFNDYIEGEDKTVTKDQAYPVTLYWIWVNDFGDMFLPSTSSYASAPFIADSNTEDREAVFDYLEAEKNSIFSGMSVAAISNALTDVQNSSSTTFRNSLTSLTTGYDNADLDIGNNINYILFEMTASTERV